MTIIKTKYLLLWFFLAIVMNACQSIPEQKLADLQCSGQMLENEKIDCYKSYIRELILRRINVGTRQLPASDWPYDYLIQVDVSLDRQGKILSVIRKKVSSNRQLNRLITQDIEHLGSLPVPHDDIFDKGGFKQLKFLFKPARNPILGPKKEYSSDYIIIYLPGNCATLSRQC